MAHFAFLSDDGVVVEVIVGRDEGELGMDGPAWERHYAEVRGLRCLRTSYNTLAGRHRSGGPGYRGNYAGIGYVYDETLDAFLPPRPEGEGWTLDRETFQWVQPTPPSAAHQEPEPQA